MEKGKVFNPSEQQSAYIDWCQNGSGNAILQAVAGAGKTTTILQACARGIDGSVVIAAFNKRIAEEIKAKIIEMELGRQVSADTFHALGFRSWRKVASKYLKVDGKKLQALAREKGMLDRFQPFCIRLVSLAKQNGIGTSGTSVRDDKLYRDIIEHHGLDEMLSVEGETVSSRLIEDSIDMSMDLLRRSNDVCTQLIDFDDMLYAPLLFNSPVWQSNWVKVDEAQDSNLVRRSFARKMMLPGGRAVFVGDERQAINGFAGADNEALNSIRQEFNCTELPLTITYRCPKSVVAEARMIVDHITAHEDAPEGIVERMTWSDFSKLDFNDPTEVILCRNNAPLMMMAYTLIRRKIGCRVEGKDIGVDLLALANKWKVRSLAALSDRLEQYSEKRVSKLMDSGKEVQAQNLQDKIESLQIIIESMPPNSELNDLASEIQKMFGDSNGEQKLLTLSSIHKSKGREWTTVYILGRDQFMPSRYARQEWQLRQEENLIYVALTRSFNKLVYVNDVPQKQKKERS